MRFTLTIDCDNAAFEDDDSELARIIRDVAKRVEGLSTTAAFEGTASDINGNTVGKFEMED